MQIIDLANHILAIKHQQSQSINQYELNQLTLQTLDWINENYLSYQIFTDYNAIQYRFKNKNQLIPVIQSTYKFYAAMPIIETPKSNQSLNQMPHLNQYIKSI